MLNLILRNQRNLFRQLVSARNVHPGPEDIDPMLKSRKDLPIITLPYYYKGNLKKIRRAIAFEEGQVINRLKKTRALKVKKETR